MLTSRPVSAPAERPVYSNIAFTLLMYAVEAHTGIKGYDKLLETYVSGPLGLKNTVVSPGDDEKAVIPPVMNSWGADYGEYAPYVCFNLLITLRISHFYSCSHFRAIYLLPTDFQPNFN